MNGLQSIRGSTHAVPTTTASVARPGPLLVVAGRFVGLFSQSNHVVESTGTVGGLGSRIERFKVAIEIGFADRRLVQPQVGDHIIQGPIQGLGQGDDDVQLGHA